MDRITTLLDGALYHFRAWPDDGETFEFRRFGQGSEGTLVNLTNPGPNNDFWVKVDGSIKTVRGDHIGHLGDLTPGPTDPMTSRPSTIGPATA